MAFIDLKIVPDTQVFRATGVSNEYGRKVMLDLETRGEIRPQKTATGRCRLSIRDAERLAAAL